MYENSPELLDIRKSSDLDLGHIQASEFKNDRIVSFDWVNLSSPVLKPRVVVLRQNGSFDILEKPSFTADHVYKMVPWQAPHRGLLGMQPHIHFSIHVTNNRNRRVELSQHDALRRTDISRNARI